jgi:peptidoglycan hydrolase CwlO-like protein
MSILNDVIRLDYGINFLISLLTLLSLSTIVLFNLLTPKLTKNFITKEELENRLRNIEKKLNELDDDIRGTKKLYNDQQAILISVKQDIEWIKNFMQSNFHLFSKKSKN